MSKEFLTGWAGSKGISHPSRVYVRSAIKDGESLLDMGCGTGIELKGFLKENRKIDYWGVDSSYERIKWCRKHYPDYEFICENIILTGFKESSFDNVLVRAILEHNLNYERIIKEAMRVSRRMVIFVLFNWSEDKEDKNLKVRKNGTICGTISLPKVKRIIEECGGRITSSIEGLPNNHYVLHVRKTNC